MTGPLPTVAILAGGLATRLRPLTDGIPKALVPVAGKPFLAHQLTTLKAQGIQRVVVCTGHLSEQIEAVFRDGGECGLELVFSHDGAELAGTAGALRKALPLLGETFFTLYGDSYLQIDYLQVWSKFNQKQAPALMTVIAESKVNEPANAWLADGIVRAYGKHESRPEMRHVDYGLGVFRADLFRKCAEVSALSELQGSLARAGRLAGFEADHRYFEIGSPRGLAELESHLQVQP